MTLEQEIQQLKSDIQSILKKAQCSCGKTLFYYNKERVEIKCGKCKTINSLRLR